MNGLVFKLEGQLRGALTRKLMSDDLSEYGTRRVYCDGRHGVRRFERFFPKRQDEPYQDKQGKWKQAWPYYVKGHGPKVCAITDKPVEESSEGK